MNAINQRYGYPQLLSEIIITDEVSCVENLRLLPMIYFGNITGHEIEYPMAWVIVGGLCSSTILNLLLMPTLYSLFGRRTGLQKQKNA